MGPVGVPSESVESSGGSSVSSEDCEMSGPGELAGVLGVLDAGAVAKYSDLAGDGAYAVDTYSSVVARCERVVGAAYLVELDFGSADGAGMACPGYAVVYECGSYRG